MPRSTSRSRSIGQFRRGRAMARSISLAGFTALVVFAIVPARADIATGLVARYDFNTAAAIGVDSSGNGNNGTLSATNAAFAVDATRGGGVLQLSGSQGDPGFVEVPDSP